VKELQSIVDYGRYDPAIDTTVFPGTNPDGYWSSSTYAYGTGSAWFVEFLYGFVYVGDNGKASTYYVRCVR
jgi:murein tripeptide amidase MpaA